MDITLHIGAHRTGTTSLQNCLMLNQGKLAGAGLAFWGPRRTRAGLFDGLICNPGAIDTEADRKARRSTDLISGELEQLEKTGVRRLIVSEENMIGTQRNNLLTERLYLHAEERLSRFRTAFAGRRLRVALSVRSQDSYWTSVLSFCFLRGIPVPNLHKLERLVAQPCGWADLAAAAARVFPAAEIVIWPFEGFAGLPDWQAELLCGGEEFGCLRHRKHWHNAAPSRDNLRKSLVAQGADPDRIAPGEGQWQPFSVDQTAALRKEYADDLAWFRSGGDGTMTYMPDVQAHECWRGELRGHDHGRWEKRVG